VFVVDGQVRSTLLHAVHTTEKRVQGLGCRVRCYICGGWAGEPRPPILLAVSPALCLSTSAVRPYGS